LFRGESGRITALEGADRSAPGIGARLYANLLYKLILILFIKGSE